MRLTVGPLPAAVYWRRRAVVLGALLLILVVVYASCSGSGSDAESKKTTGAPTSTPTAPVDEQRPSAESTASGLTPQTGAPSGDAAASADPGSGSGSTDAAVRPPAGQDVAPCADDDLAITPVPAKATIARETPVDLRLIIENSSEQACNRDIGADLQELRIAKGAETIWSSDHCGASKGSDVRTLSPGVKREYMITWNGKSSTKCAGGVPTGAVAAGQYQLLGRLGTKLSSPVVLTIR